MRSPETALRNLKHRCNKTFFRTSYGIYLLEELFKTSLEDVVKICKCNIFYLSKKKSGVHSKTNFRQLKDLLKVILAQDF